jgi:small-conductance mechanosensitive channel
MPRPLAVVLIVLALLGPRLAYPATLGDPDQPVPEQVERETAPVTLDGRRLFRVVGVPALPAAERAAAISARIAALAADRTFDPASLELAEVPLGTMIRARGKNVVTVTEHEAALEGYPRQVVAPVFAERIRTAMEVYREERTPRSMGRAVGFAVAWTLALVLLGFVLVRLGRRLDHRAERWFAARSRHLSVQGLPIVSTERVHAAMIGVLRVAKLVALALAAVVCAMLVLELFPQTRQAARALVPTLLQPLSLLGRGFVQHVPNLVFLAVTWLLTRWVLRLVRTLFGALEAGTIRLEGFEAEWATPTYRLVRLVVVALALVIAYPHIPSSDSSVFKGLSIFAGVLLSLGSTSIISNVVAGYSMTYRRAFRVGDRISIGEVVGDVEEVGVLVTRIRSLKNEEVVIPNSTILAANVVNYSAMARREGLILHVKVGIGYETPWRQVEAMLLEAVRRTAGMESTPPPFVVYRQLGDFAVEYEVNGYTRDARAMVATRSELQRNILDLFNQYGVQIMTPAYERDPEQPKLVPPGQWYAAPAQPPPDLASAPADGPRPVGVTR